MKTASLILSAALLSATICALYYREKARCLRLELDSKDDAQMDFIKGVKWAADRYQNKKLYTLPDGQWAIKANYVFDSVFVSGGTFSIDCQGSNHFHWIIDCGFYAEVRGENSDRIP